MIKFILIIFLKMSLATAQTENEQAPVPNIIETIGDLFRKAENVLLQTFTKKKISTQAQEIEALQHDIQNPSYSTEKNSEQKDQKINSQEKNYWIDFEFLSQLIPLSLQKTQVSYNKPFLQKLRQPAVSQNSEKPNKNKIDKNLSIELESSFTAKKNDLLSTGYNWKYFIPYIDTNINYKISKNILFKTEFEFSYEQNKWDYLIEEISITYQWLHFLPTDFTIGYFEYPMSDNLSDQKFSKQSLLEKNLFPTNDSDIGILLKTNFWESLYFQISWQTWTGARELLNPLNTLANTWVSSLSFEQNSQYIFASYLKQNFFSSKQKQAFGLGSHISYPINSFLLNFKGEYWKIEQAFQNTITYYIMPSVQWESLVLTFLTGKAYYQLGSQSSESREYILKTDFYLTEELFVSLERIHESDSIIKNSSWAFSIRSHFSF